MVRRKQRFPGHQGNLDRTVGRGGEPVLRRKGQLDAGRTTADHRKAQHRHLLGTGEQCFPPPHEAGDWLDGDRVLGCTWNIVGPRGRTDVDRQQVPADRRVGSAEHKMPNPVEADCLVADQPRAGKPREPTEIDMAFGKSVMPRDIARQHAGIGRLDVAADQGDPHTGHRPHAKALQHMDMGMAAAAQYEVLSDRNLLLHPPHYARGPRGRRAQPRCGPRWRSLFDSRPISPVASEIALLDTRSDDSQARTTLKLG